MKSLAQEIAIPRPATELLRDATSSLCREHVLVQLFLGELLRRFGPDRLLAR